MESLNFLGRKKIAFKYNGGEFVLIELSADKFLAAVSALLVEQNVIDFINIFDISTEQKIAVITSQEVFDRFTTEFTKLHAGADTEEELDSGQEEGQSKESLKEFYSSYEDIFAALWKSGMGNPYELSKIMTLRQLDRWIKKMFPPGDGGKKDNPDSGTIKRSQVKGGKLGFSEMPGNARKVKEWVDAAGCSCRYYEERIER